MGKINVDLAFTANTSAAKAQLDQLKNTLTQLGNMTNIDLKTSKMTQDIIQASNAALQLKAQLQAATNVNTGKLSLAKFNQELKTSGMTLADYRVKLSALGSTGTQAFAQLTQNIMQADAALSTGSKLLGNFAQTLANVAKYQFSTAVYRGVTQAISTAYTYAQDLNASLNKIRIVTGQSVEQMDKFAEKANKAAKALSTTTTAYTDAALIFYQQGLNDKEVEQRTNVVVKMMNVTGQAAEETSSQMTAIWNNFAKGSENLEHYADVITALGAATASSSKEIAEGLQKFAAIADTVGLSYEYATTALATVVAQTRQSADVVGTAFKTLFARIQDLELGKTLDDGTTLGKYAKALDVIGVNVKTASGEVKDMNSILDEMGAKWGGLSDATKIAVAQTVAGTRQYAQLMALMDNWGEFQKNLTVANDSAGTLNEQADIYAQGWEGAKKRVKASIEDIYKTLLDDKFFIGLNNGLAKVLDAISSIIKGMGGLKGIVPLVTSLLLQFAGPQILHGLTAMKTTLVGMLPSFMSLHNAKGEFKLGQTFKNIGDAAKAGYKEGGVAGGIKAVVQPGTKAEAEAENMRKTAFTEMRLMQDSSTTTGQAKISLLQKQESLQQEIANLNDKITKSEKEHLNSLMDRNRELEKTVATTGELAEKTGVDAKKAWQLESENSQDAQTAINADRSKYNSELVNLQNLSHQDRIVSQWGKATSGNATSLGLDSHSPFMQAAQESLTEAQKAQLQQIKDKVKNQSADTPLDAETQKALADIGQTVRNYLKRQIKDTEKSIEKTGADIGLSKEDTNEAIVYARSDLSTTFNKAGFNSALAQGRSAPGFKPEELTEQERRFSIANSDFLDQFNGQTGFEDLKNQYLQKQEESIGLDSLNQMMPNMENISAESITTTEQLDILKDKLRELQVATQAVGEDAAPELSAALKDIDIDSLDAQAAVEKLKAAEKGLEKDTQSNTSAINQCTTALRVKAKQEGRDVASLDKAIDATTEATNATKQHNRSIYAAKQGYEDAQKAVDQYKTKTQSLGAISMGALRGITSLASSINMLKSVISIFNDTEKSFGEKLLTALPLMLPMVTMAISSFTAFSGAIGGLTAKLFAHTIAQKLDNVVKTEGLTLDSAENIQSAIKLMKIPLLISGKQAETIAQKVLNKAKEEGTVATWGMVAAEIAAQMAAGPIVWIIMAIIAALTILITILSAVAAAEKARLEQQNESNKKLIEQNKLINESIDKNQELADSIDKLVESYQDLNKSGEDTYDTLKQMDEEIPKLIKSYKDLSEQMNATWLNNDALDLEAAYQQAKANGDWSTFQAKKDEIDKKLTTRKRDNAADSFKKGTSIVTNALLTKSGSAFGESGKISDILAGGLFNRKVDWDIAEKLYKNTSLGDFVTVWGAVSDYSKNLGTKAFGYNDVWGLKTQFNGEDPTEVLRYYKALKEASAYGAQEVAKGNYKNASGVLQDINETIKIFEESGADLEELRQIMIDLETEDFSNNQAKNITLSDYLFNQNKLIKQFTDKGYTEEEAKTILNNAEGLSTVRSAANEKNITKMSTLSGLTKQQLADYFDTALTTTGEKAAFIALSTNDSLLKNVNGNIENLNLAIQKQLQEIGKQTTSKEVQEAGLDTDVWTVYSNELGKTNDLLANHEALTGQIAKDSLRFNQGLITTAKSWKTYSAALRSGNTATTEYAEGLAALQKGFKEAFGLDISDDWVANNLDFVDKIMTGNLNQEDQITWSNMLNSNAQDFINENYKGSKKIHLNQLREDLAGASPEELLAYSQSGYIQQAIDNNWFTVEEAQQTLQAMGLSYHKDTGEIGFGVADLNNIDIDSIQKAAGTDKNSRKKHKLYEDEVDSYHEIKRAISNTKNELEEYNKIADNSVGKTKLAAMDKQIEKNKTLSEQYKLQAKEAQKQQLLYSDKILELGYNIKTVNGEIQNYTEVYRQALEEYNKAIDDFNAGQIDNDTLQEITDKYENFKNYMSEYEEATDTFKDSIEAQREAEREIQSKNYEKYTYELEIKTTLNENDKKFIEYFLDKVEDDIYKVAEATKYLTQQQNNLKDALTLQGDAYTKLEQQKGQLSQTDYVEGLQNIYDVTIDNLQALNEYDEKMKTYYSDTITKGIEEMDKYIDRMDKQTELLKHYQTLLKLSGQEFDYDKQLILLNGLVDQARLKTEKVTQEVISLEKARVHAAQQLAAADNDELRKIWQDELNRIDDELTEKRTAQAEATEEQIEALGDVFKTTLAATFKELENNVTDGLGFNNIITQLQNIKNLADLWLDDTNKTYETNKMLRDIGQAIDKTDNKAAKNRLSAFADEIKQMQNRGQLTKAELELAQSRYKVLQAQIALEEAQNAKSVVRLRRDNEGNFGYVYTADENKTADAEQKVEDEENAYYNKKLNLARDSAIKDTQLQQDWANKRKEIWQQYWDGEIASEEERDRLLKEADEYYNKAIEGNAINLQIALGNADDPQSIYGQMSDGERSYMNTVLKSTEILPEEIEKSEKVAQEAYVTTHTEVDALTAALIGSGDSGLQGATNKVKDATQELANVLGDQSSGVIKAMNDAFKAAQTLTGEWSTQYSTIQTLKEYYEKQLLPKIKEAIKKQQELNDLNNQSQSKSTITNAGIVTNLRVNNGHTEASFDNGQTWYDTAHMYSGTKDNPLAIAEGNIAYYDTSFTKDSTVKSAKTNTKNSSSGKTGGSTFNPLTGSTGTSLGDANAAAQQAITEQIAAYQSDIDDLTEQKEQWVNKWKNEIIPQAIEWFQTKYGSDEELSYSYPGMASASTIKVSQLKQAISNRPIKSIDLTEWNFLMDTGWGRPITIGLKNVNDTDDKWWQLSSNADIINGKVKALVQQINQKQQLLDAYKANISSTISSMDTGGYTGQWGSSGKLAILHQKEIVLNADDTKNFLQAVDILRSIVSVIDLGAMQAMSGSMVSSSINSANNSLNQNVTIHAEFPNAVNHTEIEQAFDNLVNKASQYANR